MYRSASSSHALLEECLSNKGLTINSLAAEVHLSKHIGLTLEQEIEIRLTVSVDWTLSRNISYCKELALCVYWILIRVLRTLRIY